MDNIKQINTGVAELLFIKAPPHITGWAIGNGVIYLSSVAVKLPPGKWEPLGIELTEEQCREIIPRYNKAYPNYGNGHDGMFLTAKEAFASLMQAHGLYSVNPLTFDPTGITTSEWAYNEANTGPHLILKNIL